MPCRDDWPVPTPAQRENQRTAQLLVYGHKKLGRVPSAVWVATAEDDFAEVNLTTVLCAFIKTLNPKGFEYVVYNAHDRMSRRMADWWEEHQEADKIREREDKKKKAEKKLKKSAAAKLTPAERRALGLEDK